MSVRSVLRDAQKAIGALTVGEAAAVSAGLLGSSAAGYVTAVLGVASAVVVYLLDGPEKKK